MIDTTIKIPTYVVLGTAFQIIHLHNKAENLFERPNLRNKKCCVLRKQLQETYEE